MNRDLARAGARVDTGRPKGPRSRWQRQRRPRGRPRPLFGAAGDLEVGTLTHRIDTIFLDADTLTALQAEVIGDEQRDRSEPSGFWPSDQAGSIAKLRTVRP